jgi:phage tail-like protein
MPGRLKWENVTLKRGITDAMDIWDWRKMVEDGDVESARANGSIVMFDQHLSEVARWNFENAWPVKVSGPQVKSDSNEIGIEELSIAHEGLWRVN